MIQQDLNYRTQRRINASHAQTETAGSKIQPWLAAPGFIGPVRFAEKTNRNTVPTDLL